MTIIGATPLPAYVSLPPGVTTKAGSNGSAPTPAAIIDVRTPLPGAAITAEAGDHFALWDLFSAGREAWDATTQYRVALRADPETPAGGRLLLDGSDVSDRMGFTRDEFLRLRFEAGAQGSRTDLLVVARRVGSGGAVTDSPAVQVTATTTGSRSLNAAEALRTEAGADEAAFVRIAKEAALYRATGTGGPTLTTVGKPPGPALSADDLVFRLGGFQAVGWRGASTAFNLAQFYSDAVGAADVQTANTAAANDRTRLLTALLLGNQVGGVQVAPNVTGQSLLVLQAYLRAQS